MHRMDRDDGAGRISGPGCYALGDIRIQSWGANMTEMNGALGIIFAMTD